MCSSLTQGLLETGAMPQSELSESDEVFDEIGGGESAGCVLVNPLSADPGRRVLSVEAGVDTPPGHLPREILDSYPTPIFFGDRSAPGTIDAPTCSSATATTRRMPCQLSALST
jgi:5-(hydroxymethyl)furfural/furfural oxidase